MSVLLFRCVGSTIGRVEEKPFFRMRSTLLSTATATAASSCHRRRQHILFNSGSLLLGGLSRHNRNYVICSTTFSALRPPLPSYMGPGWHSPRCGIRGGAARRCSLPRDDEGAAANGVPLQVLLPTLGQNGTLVLRSESGSLSELRIVSQWRDDSSLELFSLKNAVAAAEGHGGDAVTLGESLSSSSTGTFGPIKLTSHPDGIATSLGRKGALVEVDVSDPPCGGAADEPFRIVATVPEKINVTVQLAGGNIYVAGKLEGDAHLATADGSISVAKLRGHHVTLDATARTMDNGEENAQGPRPGVIHVRKAVEARTVKINATSPGRVSGDKGEG